MARQNLAYQQKRKQIVEQSIVNEKYSRLRRLQLIILLHKWKKAWMYLRNNKNNFLIMSPLQDVYLLLVFLWVKVFTTGQSLGK